MPTGAVDDASDDHGHDSDTGGEFGGHDGGRDGVVMVVTMMVVAIFLMMTCVQKEGQVGSASLAAGLLGVSLSQKAAVRTEGVSPKV
jgi:hypothetical protein